MAGALPTGGVPYLFVAVPAGDTLLESLDAELRATLIATPT
ncbi:hypothetical protein ACFRQM_20740 [Streptomyces sp. NPDC056831]